MSYIVTYRIEGYSIKFFDGHVILPKDINLDDVQAVMALKTALELAPAIDAIHFVDQMTQMLTSKKYPWHNFDDDALRLIEGQRNILLNETRITAPSNILDFCAAARDELCRREEKAIRAERKKARGNLPRNHGFVYLLQSPTSAYKIGRTADPDDRMATFSVKLPFEVEYEHLIETSNMYQLESELHARFADRRVNGEWFDLTNEDVAYIKSLEGDT